MSAIVDWRPPDGLAAVASGVGAVAERLRAMLEAAAVERAMIVCGAQVAASPLVAMIKEAAGRPLAVWTGSRPHTPAAAVNEGLAAARESNADALIALGGSSASDCAKAIAVLLRTGGAGVDDLAPLDFPALATRSPGTGAAPIPLLCVPTTLSAAELQPFFGVRDEAKGRKRPFGDQGVIRRTVLLDGACAASAPAAVWAETGVKLLDDTLYRYLTAPDDPAADALLEHALAILFAELGPSARDPTPERRQRLLHAMWIANTPLPRSAPIAHQPWLSMVARHAIGGARGIAHGVGSCVALPTALRHHHGETAARQALLARRLAFDGDLIEEVERLLDDLGVPRNLDTPRDALPLILANMAHEAPTLGRDPALRDLIAGLW